MGIGARLFMPKAVPPPEPDPPPSRSDYPDEHSFLTAHLVWQCGGKGKLPRISWKSPPWSPHL